MASEFITRVERDKDEPYTVIFSTDDADKYKHIEDECRKMIGHAKPTVDAVPVTRCAQCKWWWKVNGLCTHPKHCHDNVCVHECGKDYFCADGERRE